MEWGGNSIGEERKILREWKTFVFDLNDLAWKTTWMELRRWLLWPSPKFIWIKTHISLKRKTNKIYDLKQHWIWSEGWEVIYNIWAFFKEMKEISWPWCLPLHVQGEIERGIIFSHLYHPVTLKNTPLLHFNISEAVFSDFTNCIFTYFMSS